MQSYWLEFGTVALAHLLGVASPGPDFTLVLRQSLSHGRRVAIGSALGIGTGILVHVTYALLGLGALVRHQPQLYTGLKIVGALYLAWLGVRSLRTNASAAVPDGQAARANALAGPTQGQAWRQGFLTNVLNIKATLFFVALFSVGISPETPPAILAAYGLWMAVATAAWFSLVGTLFAQARVRDRYHRSAKWIDRLLGMVFLGFAVSLLWD